jgi:hypothetical protein
MHASDLGLDFGSRSYSVIHGPRWIIARTAAKFGQERPWRCRGYMPRSDLQAVQSMVQARERSRYADGCA